MADIKQNITSTSSYWPHAKYDYGNQAIWKYGIQKSFNKTAAKYDQLKESISYKNFSQIGKLVEHLISTQNPGGTDAIKSGPMGVQGLYKKLSQGVPFGLGQAGMSGIMQHAGAGVQAMAQAYGNNISNLGPMGPNATLTASLIGTGLMNPNVANSAILPNTSGAVAQTMMANTNPAPGMGIPTNSSSNLIHVATFSDPTSGVMFTLLNATEGNSNPITPSNPTS